MAVTSNTYTVGGSGQAGPYSYSFPILADADVKVSVNGTVKSVTTHYTLDSSNTRITFVSGQEPSTGDKVIVYRDTDEDPINSTFVSGSTIRSNELNDNFSQLLYIAQESDNQSLSTLGGVMEGDLGLGLKTDLYFEGATDNAYETTLTVVDPTADRTITLPNVTGTVVTTGDTGTVTSTMIANNTIATGDIAADAITGAQIADNAIDSEHYVDGSINRVHLDADIVDGTKIDNDAVNSEHIVDNAIDSEHYTDGSIDTVHIGDAQITTAKIADGAVNSAKIAANSVDSSELVDGSIDTSHISAGAVVDAKIGTGAVTTTKIAAGAVTTAKIADDAVTTAKIPDNAITSAKIAANSVDSSELIDGSIDASHISAGAVTTDKIADNAVTTAKIADAELSTLAGMQSGTASKLADSTALTADIADLNLLDGKSIVTTIGGNATDVQLPTAQAVNERVVELVTEVGGFHPIANETSFPSTNPDINDGAGTIVSVKALASNLTSNGSGVATIANGAGSGNTVTINGMSNSTTYAAGKGLILETTSTLHTYTFHRLVMDETGVNDAQTLVTDFNNRYRVASSAPSSSLDDGDLYFDTTVNKMKVYNASSSTWDDVATPGDFYICTFSESFDGSRTAFTVTNAPTSAQQLIVSVNGVVQKPNAGTGQPSEGFTLSGSTVTFSSAPASGSDYYVVALGSTVNIGTPSDNTVSTAKIQNLAVTTAKIANDAITGDKIATNLDLPDNNKIRFGAGNDLQIYADGSNSRIDHNGDGSLRVFSGGAESIKCVEGANVSLFHNGTEMCYTDANGLKFNDSKKILVGTGNDLQLYHNGTSYVDASNGHFYIRNNVASDAGGDLFIQAKSGENSIKCQHDGYVKLFYDDSKKLETTSAGVTITGDLTVTGSAPGGVTSDSQNNTIAGSNAGESFSGTDASNNTLFGKEAGQAITTGDHNTAVGFQAGHSQTTAGNNTWVGSYAGESATTGHSNVGIGYAALYDNTTGEYNIAAGRGALLANTTGVSNVVLGYNAMDTNTTGSQCIAIGTMALDANTTANNNVAVGYHALKANTTGTANIGIGTNAGLALTTSSNNVAVGQNALRTNTTGDDNTSIGGGSMYTTSTGAYNVAVGKNSLHSNSTGSYNVALGKNALYTNTTASNNTGVGYNALYSNTTGATNVAVGGYALSVNTTGAQNTAVGYTALDASTTGEHNVAIGYQAGTDLTTGYYNTLVGNRAGENITTGGYHVAVGMDSLKALTTSTGGAVGVGFWAGMSLTSGTQFTAIGYEAGKTNTTAGYMTAVGYRALKTANGVSGNAEELTAVGAGCLQNNTTGQYNTAIGSYAMHGLTTGSSNIGMGKNAGYAMTTATSNTFLGVYAGAQVTTGNHNICVGYDSASYSVELTTGNKNIIMGSYSRTSSAGALNQVVMGYDKTGKGDNTFYCDQNPYHLGNSSSWSTTSDRRIKKNIVDNTVGLDAINQIRVRNFEYRTEDEITEIENTGSAVVNKEGVQVGCIAQELETVLPSAVNTNEYDVKSVNNDPIIWALVNAVKELSAEIKVLKEAA